MTCGEKICAFIERYALFLDGVAAEFHLQRRLFLLDKLISRRIEDENLWTRIE